MKKLLGLLAVVGLMIFAAPAEQAKAIGLSTPAPAASTQQATDGVVTDVRWRRHYRYHPRYRAYRVYRYHRFHHRRW